MAKFHLIKDTVNLFFSHIPNFKKVKFSTILLTQFNWGTNPKGIDNDYLNKRFEIFDKYTFPSINTQSDNDFYWILLLNAKTPQKFRDKLEEYKKNATMKMILAYIDCTKIQPKIPDILKNYIDITTRYILTCRCDNDDMLAKEYISNMKQQFRPINNLFIDLIRGYNFNHADQSLNTYKCRSNHFIGYVEDLNKNTFTTVLNGEHAFIEERGFIRRIDNKTSPIWCEIIHDTNITNWVQGEQANKKMIDYFYKHFEFKQ